MRTIAAIIVIILISLYQSSDAYDKFNSKIDAFDSLKSSLRNNDQKLQKDYGSFNGGCPACDSSVYSYCDQKIFHDACCCGLNTQPQCQYSDCSYLYANSCKEHQLITNCCCYNPFRNLQ